MSEETKLTQGEEVGNMVSAMAWPIIAVAVVQWSINMWLAQYKKAKRHRKPFRPQLPHKLSIMAFGRPGQAIEHLRDYGISCQQISSFVAVENGTKGLIINFLAAESQWEMADALLSQNPQVLILSAPGSKRGAHFGQPWGVGSKARSFDEGVNGMIGNMFKSERKPAKLGKTYNL